MRPALVASVLALSIPAIGCSKLARAPEVADVRSPAPAPMSAGMAMPAAEVASAEKYTDYGVNPVVDPRQDRLSTFAVDVDTASYSISRRKLMEGALPPFQAVRAEEFLNSFDYGYSDAGTSRDDPYTVHMDAAPSPFTPGHHLVRVGIQAMRIPHEARKPVHLVYLVDTSGSMIAPDKLGLVKTSLKVLTGTLKQGDTVALCTYAGSVREVLPPTGVGERERILREIERLEAGGSTAMASGIENAYRLASLTRAPGHISHVVVLSDGDANVGTTSHEQILERIAHHRESGITLSTVGFGNGNYKDTMMEQLADKGDGNYAYIDTEAQARKVFGHQVDGMLEVVARDMKVQVELQPESVKSYRLIGYENRNVADKDFTNDHVDGGEVGAGHAVTAVYDVVLARTDVSPLTVRVRFKPAERAGNGAPDAATERAWKMDARRIHASFANAPDDLRFAASVTGLAEILRQSPHATEWRLQHVAEIARATARGIPERLELADLAARAATLRKELPGAAVAAAK